MANSFRLTGGYTVNPLGNPLSFAPNIAAVIDEAVTLEAQTVGEVLLNADAPFTLDFVGVTNANIVVMKAVSAKVVATLTTSAGAAQVVPFDTYLILMSDAAPVTSITLTRTPGTDTTVRYFLGDKA